MPKKNHHKTISFILPFPNAKLSPNNTSHWSVKARAKKVYKSACAAFAYQANKNCFHDIQGRVTVKFVFHPPRRAKYDEDNLLARMKSGIDGIAIALKTDDSHFHYAPIKIADPVPLGAVEVKLSFYCHEN